MAGDKSFINSTKKTVKKEIVLKGTEVALEALAAKTPGTLSRVFGASAKVLGFSVKGAPIIGTLLSVFSSSKSIMSGSEERELIRKWRDQQRREFERQAQSIPITIRDTDGTITIVYMHGPLEITFLPAVVDSAVHQRHRSELTDVELARAVERARISGKPSVVQLPKHNRNNRTESGHTYS